jgi:peptide/nickel transport system ATP-binding protein
LADRFGVVTEPLLAVRNLVTEFSTERGTLRAVDGVSFEVGAGRTVGLVGESGCGKSVTALSVMRLLASPPARIAGGEILYRGQDLARLPERDMRALRGDRIAMIFQEPMTSLNPVYTVGDQVGEPLRLHRGMSRRAARAEAIALLGLVGIADPERRVDEYPHQMSGGMRQRVMIAMALACRPDLLIADEPTTALDVTIQAQILELLGRLQRELGMAVLLITHDLGVVAESCDEVVVMYAGQVVERAPVDELFARPRHPYTAGLLRAVPPLGADARRTRLAEIPGMVPRLDALPPGCRFQERCDRAQDLCRERAPELVAHGALHFGRCHFPIDSESRIVSSTEAS